MDDEIPHTSLVPGLKYTIHSEFEEGDLGYDEDAPYTGVFVSRRGLRSTFRDVKNKSGRDEGNIGFGQEHYYTQDAFRKGRELTAVKELGASKNLPEDVESVIGQFLTGKKKSTTKGQMDKLKQDTGVSLAPRAGTRRKVTTKKEAKKTCSPGYEVYNFRKTRKGVFYDCAPKRKTRRYGGMFASKQFALRNKPFEKGSCPMYTGEFLRMFSSGGGDMSIIDKLEPYMRGDVSNYMMRQCFGPPLFNTNPSTVNSYDPEHTTDTQIDEGLKLAQKNNLKGILSLVDFKNIPPGRLPTDTDNVPGHVIAFATETTGPHTGQLVFFNPKQIDDYVEGTGLHYVDANSKTWTKRTLLDELPGARTGAKRDDNCKVYR
jgi:hypothetical protein